MGIFGLRALILVAAASLCLACSPVRDDASTGTAATGTFVERSVRFNGAAYRYQIFVPAAYRREKAAAPALPVILFLHGTGERGDDGDKPTRVGIGPLVRTQAAMFPALVVFPQAPEGQDWNGLAAQIALAALDAASAEFRGDPERTYLTGMSMGGYGTWELALMQPQRFAALVPVCGGLTAPRPGRDLAVTPLRGEPDPSAALAQRLRHMPIWIFHGAKDDVVPPRESRAVFAALKTAGGDVRYTEFPDADHNSWGPAYSRTPQLWEWLFAQRRR
jgi:predicted peptidase